MSVHDHGQGMVCLSQRRTLSTRTAYIMLECLHTLHVRVNNHIQWLTVCP